MRRPYFIIALCLICGCMGRGELPDDPLATTSRLADRYPGDHGIEQDSAVLFAEDFDHVPLPNILHRFTNQNNPTSFSLVEGGPPQSAGQRSLRIVSVGGSSTGGTLYKRLSRGYDRLFLRYYVKYPTGSSFHHTSAWMGGYNPPTDWMQGQAGLKPQGHDRFMIGAEPVDAYDRFDFYVYWMGMRGGPGAYWGNHLIDDPRLGITRDRWTCVEVMAQMNEPVTDANGELALWIDNVFVSHYGSGFPKGTWAGGIYTPHHFGEPFEGFQWRNDPALQLNWFMLQHYSTKDAPGVEGYVLYDHVVLATSRVGCLSSR